MSRATQEILDCAILLGLGTHEPRQRAQLVARMAELMPGARAATPEGEGVLGAVRDVIGAHPPDRDAQVWARVEWDLREALAALLRARLAGG